MNVNDSNQQQAIAQIQVIADELIHWIVSSKHTRPSRIVHLPEGVHDLTPEQSKRMADEYELVDRLITILSETALNLQNVGARPLTYDEQIGVRFNALMHPNIGHTIKTLRAWYLAYTSQQPNASLAYTTHLQILVEMFERIELLRNSYAHLLYTPQRER